MTMTDNFARRVLGSAVGPPGAGEIRACLVLGMDRTCPSCGQHVHEEPAVIPQGLAPWQDVKVLPITGDLSIDLDRDLYWTAPVGGEMGWGLVDGQGRLLFFQMLYSLPGKGDQVWVQRGSPERG